MQWLIKIQQVMIQTTTRLDFLATLPIRLYLAAVFWVAGTNKIAGFAGMVEWFGNSEWGLGLPFPELMASLAIAAEVGGAMLLLLGLATRWASIPLIVTMLVAIFPCIFKTAGKRFTTLCRLGLAPILMAQWND